MAFILFAMWKTAFLQTLFIATLSVPHSVFAGNSSVSLSGSKRSSTGGIRIGVDVIRLSFYASDDGRKVIAITSDADLWFRIWCSSKDDDIDQYYIYPGQSMAFSFRPAVEAVVWCTLKYKNFWARWDVYNNYSLYINQSEKAYHYIVRNDGIYISGRKVSNLESGEHRYVLWEHYDDDKKAHGLSLIGYVDRAICNNLPGWIADKTSAVTLCDKQCIFLYEFFNCVGLFSRFQAEEGCSNFTLTYLDEETSSVKGC